MLLAMFICFVSVLSAFKDINSQLCIVFICKVSILGGGLQYKAHVSACSSLVEYIVQLYTYTHPLSAYSSGSSILPISWCNRLSIPTSHQSSSVANKKRHMCTATSVVSKKTFLDSSTFRSGLYSEIK